ncbi:deoxyribose-phosphate aldolase [Halolamina sp.]|uniref:2-deoxyribose-5-phosphate aldolase n=1 Tax=Halolamina sp. TaxID=1940283 RepID=UPI003563D5EB
MDQADLAPKIDHTVLGPETTWSDTAQVLEEAAEFGMNACIPPCYVTEAAEYAPDVPLATVIGFPHGQNDPAAKRAEAACADEDGADELDVVINIGRLKAGDDGADRAGAPGEDGADRAGAPGEDGADRAGAPGDEAVREELAGVVAATPLPVKVIIETALLTDDEKHRACEAAAAAGADMVKTSTGFADGGATVADVTLMSEYLPVKASGGVGSYEEAMAMLEAGAERIGASSGVEILSGAPDA